MALMTRSTHDPKLTRWWWRTLREWVYELIDPLWGAFRGENTDDIALANVTGINDVSASELAVLDGLTATNTELNKLSGLTADAAELNKADRTQADGVAEASKNVVLDANKDLTGKRYDINQSLLDNAASLAAMFFDGVNDEVALPVDTNLTSLSQGTITITFRELSSGNTLFSVGDDSAQSDRFQFCANSIYVSEAGVALLHIVPDQPSLNTWHHLVYTADSTGNAVYLDGVKLSPTYNIGGPTTPDAFISYVTAITQVAFGKRVKGGTDDMYYHGSIADLRLFNRVLTSEEVMALASGKALDFADVGASQSDLVTNGEDWTGATGSTPPNNWSDTGAGTATYIIRDNTPVANFGDDKTLELNISGGSKTLYQGVAQAGKRYRVSFVYRNLDGSSSSYVALGSSDNKVTLQNTGISGDGIVFEQELLADGTDLKFFVDTGGTLQIDHVQVTQVGCVAAYLPDGITHAQWQDASGNDLHGSVNGAIPLNLPSGHVARYIKQGITGDTTLSAAVPAGYRIKSMVADVSGAGAGMRLNIGTSAGGTDVVNNQDISSNGLFDLTVAKNIFSFSTAQSLYVNDDGGTAWSGVSVDLYIDLERVK